MWFGPNVKLHQNGAGTSTEGRPTHPYPAFIVGRIFYLLLHPQHPHPIHQPTLPLFCMKNHPRIPIEVSLQYFCWNKPKVAGEWNSAIPFCLEEAFIIQTRRWLAVFGWQILNYLCMKAIHFWETWDDQICRKDCYFVSDMVTYMHSKSSALVSCTLYRYRQ